MAASRLDLHMKYTEIRIYNGEDIHSHSCCWFKNKKNTLDRGISVPAYISLLSEIDELLQLLIIGYVKATIPYQKLIKPWKSFVSSRGLTCLF